MPTDWAPPAAPPAASTAALNARVTAALADFFDRAAKVVDAVGPEVTPLVTAARDFVLTGGKRLRPAFCYWGYRGAGGPDSEPIVRAAASLELLHACALIHDDVMDGSDIRRGRPAAHQYFAQLHRDSGWSGRSDAFGTSAAILLGDLCLIWADQMYHEASSDCSLHARLGRRAAASYAEMRSELMAGQYLDVLASVTSETNPANPADPTKRALRVARYKSAKYTVERPLHLGGVHAGASPELLCAYSDFGLPLGEAFQLRDDVLGVFGDPGVTGKPAGDDLREGKRTALLALAERRATRAQAAVLKELIGDPDLDAAGIDTCRTLIAGSGALDEVEKMIARRGAQARDALVNPLIAEPARDALATLAAAALDRSG